MGGNEQLKNIIMLLPYIFLSNAKKQSVENSLALIDTYEYQTGTTECGLADLNDCIDDADGTLDF